MDTNNRHITEFRRKPIYPTVDDINRKEVPNLSPNLIGESYQNSDHYFKTQFELIREESVRPLVDAVNKLRQILAEEKEKYETPDTNNQTKDDRKKKLREKIDKEVESNVYFDIKLIESAVELDYNYGSVLKFTFDYKPIENIDLIDCQHLKDGGILCLSSDNFHKSIIFGIIVKSQLREKDFQTNERIWNFCLKLDFDSNGSKHFNEMLLRANTTYLGVESPSFYEGFRHSLKRLQNMSQDFPLHEYIVKIPKGITAPPYLAEDTAYDLLCIKKSEKVSDTESQSLDQKPNPLSSVQLLKNKVREKRDYDRGVAHLKECSTFDTRQFDAFYAALTKQFCIIEGPPGTGKTFVGLKIVQCLLNNRLVWNKSSQIRPILIVCFKNHALDQFLEGILKFNKNLVRIGGSSESTELEDYKLGTIEQKFREHLELQKQLKINCEDGEHLPNGFKLDPNLIAKHKKVGRLRHRIRDMNDSVRELTKNIADSFKSILPLTVIQPFIKPQILFTNYFNRDLNSLTNWLNAENEGNFDTICGKQLNRKLPMEAFDEISSLIKQNILELKPSDKWLLYLYWRQQFHIKTQKEIKVKLKSMAEEIDKLRPKRAEFQQMLCKGREIIGLTVTGAAKYEDLVKALNPQIMIVEEAAEVLEGHVVSALSSTIEHLILIGDHKQLRPLTNVQQLTDEYKLDVSLFERLIENKLPFIQLELQHRMRPCISELLKVGQIYDNLRNGERVANYPNINYTFGKNMFFLDHQHIEDSNFCRDVPDKSRSNLVEAKLVVELVKYFLLRNYPEDDITVLTTYNAQLSLIRKLMFDEKNVFVKEVVVDSPSKPSKYIKSKKSFEQNMNEDSNGVKPEEKLEKLRVRVSSVDGFQGEENNIIIISFVRSSKRNAIGFLGNKNRVNVALSRAKHALYCIGNFTIMAKEEKTQMWSQIIEHLSDKQCFGEEFTIGCKCTEEQSISMPGQLQLLNLQIENGRCKCLPLK